MSGRCLEGVWGCLSDSGYFLGGMMCKKQINIQADSFSLAYSFFSQLPRIGQNVLYFGVSGRCLRGVLVLSEWLWILSGGYDVKAIDNHPVRLISISLFLFLPVTSDWTRYSISWGVCRVSGKCLGGVWGCLSDSGYCQGGYGVDWFDESPIWMIFVSCVIFSQWPFLSNF